jgi:DNA-binding XRE family transcriptional regulator
MQPHIAQMRETLEMLQAQLAQFFATVQAEKGKS